MADLTFSVKDAGDFILHHAEGGHARITDFRPQSEVLVPGEEKRFVPYGGRSSDGVLPFFNLEKPDSTGIITGVGWSGQWEVSFTSQDDTCVDFQAGIWNRPN